MGSNSLLRKRPVRTQASSSVCSRVPWTAAMTTQSHSCDSNLFTAVQECKQPGANARCVVGPKACEGSTPHHVLVSVRSAFLALAKTRSIFTSGSLARQFETFEAFAVGPLVQKNRRLPTEERARNPKRAQVHILHYQAQGSFHERWTQSNTTLQGSQRPLKILS